MCKYMEFSEGLIHSAPMVCSLFEILATEMVFLHRDSWIMFLAGIVYMIFNAIGSITIGKGIYPAPFDWSNFWTTLACWFA